MPEPYMTIKMVVNGVEYVQNYFNQNDPANTDKVHYLEYSYELLNSHPQSL